MSRTIDNTQDIIDSRDVIARIEELRGERDALNDDIADGLKGAQMARDDWEKDNGDDLRALEALAEEAEGYAADWRFGEQLIRDSYFQEYAQYLAFDTGAITDDAQWPNRHIDWAEAARELQQDYTSVDFAGVTYWVR